MNYEEEEFAFYYEIGRAITQWARVEQSLFYVVASCFSKGDRPTLGASFYSIENFRSKLVFSDKVIREKYQDDQKVLKKWGSIHDKLSSAAKTRNFLAHSSYITVPFAVVKNKAGRREALVPMTKQYKNDLLKDGIPKKTMFIKDVIIARNNFYALRASLMNFGASLRNDGEQFPKSDEQPARPPTIQQIAARNRAKFVRPE